MPLYEYECTTCHRRIEKIQKFSAPELTVCPHCGGKLERTITAAAVSFKGGGWFKDGYGSVKPLRRQRRDLLRSSLRQLLHNLRGGQTRFHPQPGTRPRGIHQQQGIAVLTSFPFRPATTQPLLTFAPPDSQSSGSCVMMQP